MDVGAIDILSILYNNVINCDKTAAELKRTDNIFNDFLKEAAIEDVKTYIYNKFNIKVNVSDSKDECTIPCEVLYRMNSDTVLREKVYTVLADYKNTKSTLAGFYPPVKKYTLAFDGQGNVLSYILEPDMERLEEDYGKSSEKNYRFNRVSLETCNYNEIINHLLYGSYQGCETQCSMMAADFLKKLRLTDVN